jgi:hypothetical protein
MIVAFYGRIGSGKTHATSVLTERLGYSSARFGQPIKEMMSAYLRYRGVDEDTIHRMFYGDLKHTESPHLNGRTPRHAMQTLGDGWGRDMMDLDFWIEAVDAHGQYRRYAGGSQRVVMEDVRRKNEAAYVRSLGGVIVGLTGGDPKRAVMDHASETEEVVADVVLHNDFTRNFEIQVLTLVGTLEALP